MSCEPTRERLSAYLDGDVSAAARAEIDRHLAGCAACRGELESLRDLIDRARALRRDIEPERDLWPEIQGRLEPRRGGALRSPWWRAAPAIRLAAAAVLVAALALLVAERPEAPAGVPRSAAPAAEELEAGPRSELALASERARVEDGLLQVREDLLRSIAVRREAMDPATRELVERNLEIIDRAIGELHRALERHPESGHLGLLLGAAYQREVGLLQQINRL